METFCDRLENILNKIPAYSEAGIAEIEKQQQGYDALLNEHLEGNATIKKHLPVCYDIGLNIGRAKKEQAGKKQQFWFDKAREDFKSDVAALKIEMNCLNPNWS
jgi:hypothetical protein